MNEVNRSGKKILIAEDERELAEMMAAVLESRGFEVEMVHSGHEALKKFAPGRFTVLITDLIMPVMGGIDLVRRVRALDPGQCIIVISGFPTTQSRQEAARLGSITYLAKPFGVARFLEAVAGACARHPERLLGPTHLSCEDVIHMYTLEGRSTILEVCVNEECGRIYFKRGEVVHAEVGELQGEEAFFRIQSYRGAVFRSLPLEGLCPRHTIYTSVDVLLLKGAQMRGEMVREEKD